MENIVLEFNNIDNIYSEFSSTNNKILKKKFAQHLEEAIDEQDTNEDINLIIKCEEKLTKQQKDTATTTIKKYYSRKLKQSENIIKKNKIIALSMLIVAILLIICLHFLNEINTHYIITTILEVVVWVFAWESTDIIFFKNTKDKQDKKLYKQILSSTIIYK